MLPDTMTISNKLGKCILWKTADQKEVLLPLFFNNFPLTFCFCISSFSWWMSLRGNVLLSQNERLGGLWTYVIRIIKPFSFLSSLLFYVLCFPMWPFLWENHQAFISFSPFTPCKNSPFIPCSEFFSACLEVKEHGVSLRKLFHVPVKILGRGFYLWWASQGITAQ